jgi:hypothetical protein
MQSNIRTRRAVSEPNPRATLTSGLDSALATVEFLVNGLAGLPTRRSKCDSFALGFYPFLVTVYSQIAGRLLPPFSRVLFVVWTF